VYWSRRESSNSWHQTQNQPVAESIHATTVLHRDRFEIVFGPTSISLAAVWNCSGIPSRANSGAKTSATKIR
jgi:hypothetical protein